MSEMQIVIFVFRTTALWCKHRSLDLDLFVDKIQGVTNHYRERIADPYGSV